MKPLYSHWWVLYSYNRVSDGALVRQRRTVTVDRNSLMFKQLIKALERELKDVKPQTLFIESWDWLSPEQHAELEGA